MYITRSQKVNETLHSTAAVLIDTGVWNNYYYMNISLALVVLVSEIQDTNLVIAGFQMLLHLPHVAPFTNMV